MEPSTSKKSSKDMDLEREETMRLLGELVKRLEQRLEQIQNVQLEEKMKKKESRNMITPRSNTKEGEEVVEGTTSYIGKLSDEVLEMILDKVKDPRDLACCFQASTKFRKILEPKKADFLLPVAFLHVMRFLRKREITKCRLLNQDWRNIVDSEVQKVIYDSKDRTGGQSSSEKIVAWRRTR